MTGELRYKAYSDSWSAELRSKTAYASGCTPLSKWVTFGQTSIKPGSQVCGRVKDDLTGFKHTQQACLTA
jgi:hypothetical protein